MIIDTIKTFDIKTLSVLQRVLLVTDGTVTKILEAYTLEPIQVVKLSEDIVEKVEEYHALGIDLAASMSILRRKILLRTSFSKVNLIYAESLVVLDRLDEKARNALQKSNKPIGQVLLDGNVETYRTISSISKELSPTSSAYFDLSKETYMISRSYIISTKGCPIMLITEKFPESHFLRIER